MFQYSTRKSLLMTILAFAIASPAFAIPNKDIERDTRQPLIFTVMDVQDDEDNSFLDVSPVTLYKMLIEEKKKVHSLAQSVMMMRERIMKEQREDADRLTELERIVSGLQKQVTILHGKKVDKPAKKSAQPKTIPLVDSNTDRTGYWQTFTTNPPTTEWVQFKPIAGSDR